MPPNVLVRREVQYLQTQRPWLSLYGTRIRPVAPFGSLSSNPPIDISLIHQALPDELLFEVFLRMTPYSLGRAGCVCRKWRYATRNPYLWQNVCMNAWQMFGREENNKMVQSCYGGSWRKMWISRPRLRFDGLFVSRNTYIRAGVAEWKVTNPVHLVCYYRYIRFYPSGRFLYKVSPLRLKEVAKIFQGRGLKSDSVYSGKYTLNHDQVEAAVLYPGLRPTVLRILLRIRGTILGAYNRMDLVSLVTSGLHEELRDHDENLLEMTSRLDDENPDDMPAISHRRGLAPFVFVPFTEVDTSDLNLPVDKMDYFVPG